MGAYLCIASNDVPPAVSKRVSLNVHCEYINCEGGWIIFLGTAIHFSTFCGENLMEKRRKSTKSLRTLKMKNYPSCCD